MALSIPPQNSHHQEKTWLDIAERITKEQDSQKLSELTNELIGALDEQAEQRKPRQAQKRSA